MHSGHSNTHSCKITAGHQRPLLADLFVNHVRLATVVSSFHMVHRLQNVGFKMDQSYAVTYPAHLLPVSEAVETGLPVVHWFLCSDGVLVDAAW